MTTFLFVHGIGVRAKDLKTSLQLIEEGIGSISGAGGPHTLQFCYWGSSAGTPFTEEFRSIPRFAERGGGSDEEAQRAEEAALWDLLYRDPLFELRLLASDRSGEADPDAEEQLTEALATLSPSGELAERLRDAGLLNGFDQARQQLLAEPSYLDAVARVGGSWTRYRVAIARALLALAVVRCPEPEQALRFAGSRDLRQRLEALLIDGLGGKEGGLGDWLTKAYLYPLRSALRRNFGGFARNYYRELGDIFHYRGEGGERIRGAIREHLRAIHEPVVLLGHSLGGIASFELLLEEALRAPSQRALDLSGVRALVTVGSQAPFLYEINALRQLKAHNQEGTRDALPADFPSWLNLYDPEDLLGFMARPVFGPAVAEQMVISGQPFPAAHSAYWTNPETWQAIAAHLR
jgi:hypothetical protein